jgi:hypothetical protein
MDWFSPEPKGGSLTIMTIALFLPLYLKVLMIMLYAFNGTVNSTQKMNSKS